MEIKNLSQLKRFLREGHNFIIVKHFIKPEYRGSVMEYIAKTYIETKYDKYLK